MFGDILKLTDNSIFKTLYVDNVYAEHKRRGRGNEKITHTIRDVELIENEETSKKEIHIYFERDHKKEKRVITDPDLYEILKEITLSGRKNYDEKIIMFNKFGWEFFE